MPETTIRSVFNSFKMNVREKPYKTFVTLLSKEEKEFKVPIEIACMMETVKSFIS